MNIKLATICLLAGALTLPIVGYPADSDQSTTKEYA